MGGRRLHIVKKRNVRCSALSVRVQASGDDSLLAGVQYSVNERLIL